MGTGGSFTEMSCGRFWTMTETKERFEHCTSKNSFAFQFCVSPVSSTTESFFLSLPPLLIAACRIPSTFFSSPVFVLSPSSASYVPDSLPSCILMLSAWTPPPNPNPLCSDSLCSISHLLHPSVVLTTMRHVRMVFEEALSRHGRSD